jgi:hypothetical protein
MNKPAIHSNEHSIKTQSHKGNKHRELTILTSRMLIMINRMVYGCPNDPNHTPYDLYEAAKAVGYQRRAARHLLRSTLFVNAYEDELREAGWMICTLQHNTLPQRVYLMKDQPNDA